MRLYGLAAFAWALASAAAGAPLPAPLGPASDGKLQCYVPNPAARTCQSLAAYELGADGAILNTATTLISATPLVTMRTTTPVTIKAGRVCGFIRAEDIAAAQFTVGGEPASTSLTAVFRERIAAAQKAAIGREICTAYVADGGGLIAQASVDGLPNPAMDQKVVWVSPGDGFKVQP